MYVGPLGSADQASLEALYNQARDSYYSGRPLIGDDMYDKVEMQLRWFHSPLVLKHPRCSLRRMTAYSDAENDPSQMGALVSIWGGLFALGVALGAGPLLASGAVLWGHATSEEMALGIAHLHAPSPGEVSAWLVACAASCGLGGALMSAASSSLKGLKEGQTAALRGACPACSEEVYAFVKVDPANGRPRHKTECHVCGQRLVFHAYLKASPREKVDSAKAAGNWVYGRIYTVAKADDLRSSQDSD